jgi:isopentenyl phosphate kinase
MDFGGGTGYTIDPKQVIRRLAAVLEGLGGRIRVGVALSGLLEDAGRVTGVLCHDGVIVAWPSQQIELALARGLTPLVFGDAVLDSVRGGTIASTEELFAWLAPRLRPARIVLAGTVDGVYSSDPLLDFAAQPWPVLTPADLPRLRASLGGSHGVDVTGGMASKVTEMGQLVANQPGLEVRLVSGLRPEAIYRALLGAEGAGGTLIFQPALNA